MRITPDYAISTINPEELYLNALRGREPVHHGQLSDGETVSSAAVIVATRHSTKCHSRFFE